MRNVFLAVLLSGCFLLTDGATRLAGALGDAAERLRASKQERLEFSFIPDGRPDGVRGRYEIVLQESLNHPQSGGSLLVGDLDSQSYEHYGYSWSTTSHLRHVRVPQALTVRKNADEPTTFVLQRVGDTVDVIELR